VKQSIQIVVRVTQTLSAALEGYGPAVCGQPTLDDLMRFVAILPMANRPPESFLGFDRFTAESGPPPKLVLGRSTRDVDGLKLKPHKSIEPAKSNFVFAEGRWFYGDGSLTNVYELSTLLTLAANPHVAKRVDAATGDQS
jgi:hypothetical protein